MNSLSNQFAVTSQMHTIVRRVGGNIISGRVRSLALVVCIPYIWQANLLLIFKITEITIQFWLALPSFVTQKKLFIKTNWLWQGKIH